MSDYNPSMMPGGPPMGTHRDAQAMLRYDANKKSVMVAYVLWFFFGWLGAHRFYLKRIASAVVMLVLCLVSLPLTIALVGYLGLAVVGIWALVDAFLIPGLTRDYNNRLITSLGM
jgi:TM2 domain-containing membrane protein YozV